MGGEARVSGGSSVSAYTEFPVKYIPEFNLSLTIVYLLCLRVEGRLVVLEILYNMHLAPGVICRTSHVTDAPPRLFTTMDLSDASSPAVPPSSAVTPAADNAQLHGRNIGIDDEDEVEEAPRRTRRARNAFEGNIPVVTDPTADRLRERFYQFLTE